VFAPGELGRLVNGGAWLHVGGVAVDLMCRNVDEVAAWTERAERGVFEIQREVGYIAGIATCASEGSASQDSRRQTTQPPEIPCVLARRL
jgi:hypothetical protein